MVSPGPVRDTSVSGESGCCCWNTLTESWKLGTEVGVQQPGHSDVFVVPEPSASPQPSLWDLMGAVQELGRWVSQLNSSVEHERNSLQP